MQQYLSDKLRVISLVSMALVLYIHAGFHADEIAGMTALDYLQHFLSGLLGRCAVPLFYLISGYLFFLKVPDGFRSVLDKIKKRLRTLLIPYIIGCVFFVVLGVGVALVPGTARFMNSTLLPLQCRPVTDVLYAIFYDAGNGMPCAFHLWFLRDLLLIVLTSPLWYLCLKRLKWVLVAIIFVLTYVPIPWLPFQPLFWFVLGDSMVSVSLSTLDARTTASATVLFLLLSLAQLFMPALVPWHLLNIPITLLGIVAIWGLYDLVAGRHFELSAHRLLATSCHFVFFIYLFHEPTINIVRKLIVVALGTNVVGYTTSYLLSPWVFMTCAVAVGVVFRRCLPAVYRFCTGGR